MARLVRLPWLRLARLGVGTVTMGVGIALLVASRLGIVPMDTVHLALAHTFGWTFGGGIIATQSMLLMSFVPLRIPVGVGTVLAFVIPALVADMLLSMLVPPENLVARIAAFATGGVLFAVGVALYLTADCGRLPRDGIMLALSGDRKATGARGWRLSLVRTGIDVAFVAIAAPLLGPAMAAHTGVLAVGTLALAIGTGPLIAVLLQLTAHVPGFLQRSGQGTGTTQDTAVARSGGRHHAAARRPIVNAADCADNHV